MHNYDCLLNTRTADKWKLIGLKRRAGICIPLYSIYSSNSTGIGEISDLELLIDWCSQAGLSILQLLPLNDVGNDFAPYNSISTFALDPMYLSLQRIKGIIHGNFEEKLMKIRSKFRPRFGRVNYRIKKAKIELLWEIFKLLPVEQNSDLNNFISRNEFWIYDYSLYKVIAESLPDNRWELWNDSIKNREFDALSEIESDKSDRLRFYYWVQWQLFEQMKEVKEYAESKGILIMGDLPFLVSRESADVWANQSYFRLDLSSGAPPDMYFAHGQNWGMPPYNWDNIANDGFVYAKEKLKYAENFYHLYRIDHFVGLFRVWVSSLGSSASGGSFLPSDENLWEIHGRRIIDEILSSTSMLPCAEDLGTVPDCSARVLHEYGIPGIEFQRYMKSNFHFRSQNEYRLNSCAVLSTHDSAFFINWWNFEAGTIDEKLFEIIFFENNANRQHYNYVKNLLFDLQDSGHGRLRWKNEITGVDHVLKILKPFTEKVHDIAYLYLETYGEKKKFLEFIGRPDLYGSDSAELIFHALKCINASKSIFSIQLLHEYLCLDGVMKSKIGKFESRINTPGKYSRKNWSQILPISLEKLMENRISATIKEMLTETGRV